MARPRERGVNYFPLDCDFFADDKINYVMAVCGSNAVLGYLRLLCSIYRKGLCWRMGEVEIVALAAACDVETNVTRRWLKAWLDCGLFDEQVFRQTGYLTSKRIQKQYLEITKGRVEVRIPQGVLLIDEDRLPKNVTVLLSISKDKEKEKGNYEFPTQSLMFIEEKLTETPKPEKSQKKNSVTKSKKTFNSCEKHVESLPGWRDKTQNIATHVWISRDEYTRLVTEFSPELVKAKVTSLAAGIENRNKKYVAYRNHYMTMLNWLRSDKAQGKIHVEKQPAIRAASRAEAERVVNQIFKAGDIKTIP